MNWATSSFNFNVMITPSHDFATGQQSAKEDTCVTIILAFAQ